MTTTISRDQQLMVFFYVMNFMYLDKLFQLRDVISSIIKWLLTNKHIIIMKVNHDNHNNNNDNNQREKHHKQERKFTFSH